MVFLKISLGIFLILSTPFYALSISSFNSSNNLASFPIGIDAFDYQNSLPILRDLVIAREASSHDRKGGNDNGFTNKAEYVRSTSFCKVVILDVEGPGCIYSLWYSWPNHPKMPSFIEKAWAIGLRDVKIFFDNETKPMIDLPIRKLIGSNNFIFPFAFTAEQSTGGYVSYVPLCFKKGVKMEIGGGKLPMFFYHMWYHTYPYGMPVDAYTGNEGLNPLINQWHPDHASFIPSERLHHSTNIIINPGDQQEIMIFDQPGIIRSIRMQLPEDDNILKSMRLIISWDDESSPSVDAPLSLFYAVENRFRKEAAIIVENAPLAGPVIGQDSNGFYYFNLPMPFNHNARIALANDSDQPVEIKEMLVELDPIPFSGLGESAGYFKTYFNSSSKLEPNRDYLFAHILGRGHLVGTVLAVEDTSETFLEGDERIYVDGNRSPLIIGDATETYFNGSWYFGEKAFSTPFHGAPTFRMYDKAIGSNADITMYRFHLTDIVPFRSEVQFSIQHGPFNNVAGNYRSLVFYYSLPEKILERTDRIEMGNEDQLAEHHFQQEGKSSVVRIKSGFFEGEQNGSWLGELNKPKRISPNTWNVLLTIRGIFNKPKKDSPDLKTFIVREDLDPYEFTVKIDPQNQGALLRRLFNQRIPDQKAEIEVDGKPAGVWFNAGYNRWKRWAEDDFMIGPWLTTGREQLRIRISPLSDIFTSSEYQVFSLVKP